MLIGNLFTCELCYVESNVNLSIHLDTVLAVSVAAVWDWRMALWWIDIHLWLVGHEFLFVDVLQNQTTAIGIFTIAWIFRKSLRIVVQFLSRFMGIIFRFDYFCVDSLVDTGKFPLRHFYRVICLPIKQFPMCSFFGSRPEFWLDSALEVDGIVCPTRIEQMGMNFE